MENLEPGKAKCKSKIPVFHGANFKKKTKVAFKDVPDKQDLRSNWSQRNESSHTPQRLNKDKSTAHSSSQRMIDPHFEPDLKALKSILSNRGIETGHTVNLRTMSERIVPAVTPIQPSRVSVWESNPTNNLTFSTVPPKTPVYTVTPKVTSTASTTMDSYNEHVKNMKIFREKMQQLKEAQSFEVDPAAIKSILDGQGVTVPVTRPSYYKNYSTSGSLMDAYLEHEANVRILRQKTQGLFNGLSTPYKSGQEVNWIKSPFSKGTIGKPVRTPSSAARTNGKNCSWADKTNERLKPLPEESTCNSREKSGFSNFISDYRPTSILKNTQANKGDFADISEQAQKSFLDRAMQKNDFIRKPLFLHNLPYIANSETSKNSVFHPRTDNFSPEVSDVHRAFNNTDSRCVPSHQQITSVRDTLVKEDIPSQSSAKLASTPHLTRSNCLYHPDTSSLSATTPETNLPLRTPLTSLNNKPPQRVPVTPKQVDEMKLQKRVPVTPIFDMLAPGRTPCTPKNSELRKLPQRIPRSQTAIGE